MDADPVQYGILLVMGAVLWLWSRSWHHAKASRHPPNPVYFVNVPQWLVWLCGKPRQDGQLELGATMVQTAVVFQVLLMPLFLAFSTSPMKRAYVSFLVWSVGIGLAGVFRIAYFLWLKLRR